MSGLLKSLTICRLLGVEIKVHWSWLLMFLLVIDFKDSATDIFFSILFVFMIFTFILIHEFGHILAGRQYGVNTQKVVLNLLGGVALMDEGLINLTPKQSLWVTFAGPLTNLVMFFMFLPFFGMVIGDIDLDVVELSGLQNLYLLGLIGNATLFLFNLVPIYPMDGGRLLRSTLELFNVKNYLVVSIRISQIFCLLIIFVGIIIGSVTLPIIGVIFFLLAIYEIRTNRKELELIDAISTLSGEELDKASEIINKNGKRNDWG